MYKTSKQDKEGTQESWLLKWVKMGMIEVQKLLQVDLLILGLMLTSEHYSQLQLKLQDKLSTTMSMLLEPVVLQLAIKLLSQRSSKSS